MNSQPANLDYNNFGATIGGPAIPGKMFFFFSEEVRRITRAPASLTANVYDPAWLTDPANSNYVAPAQRDPNAVKLLGLWPAPNVAGRTQFINSAPNINNTRQEVARVDYDVNQNWRLTGRYSHDNSFTREPSGLFLLIQVPNVATTDTNVPGQVASVLLRGVLGPSKMNELQFQFSSNRISDTTPDGTRNRQSDYGVSLNEMFPGNATGLVPFITVTGMSQVGANQLFNIEYKNYTVTDSFTWQRGTHSIKAGGLVAFEGKNENAANQTQGNFTFGIGGGRTAFQNFLTGNRDGLCGNACTYSEAQTDVTVNLHFNRYEMFAQDSWRPRPNVTVDYGVRYSLYPPVTDANNVLTNFSPALYVAVRAPACANAGVLADHDRHRRSAERHRRRRPELAVRRRHLQVRQEQRAAADRRHLGSGVERPYHLPRVVRGLLRPGAGRHLRAERLREPAVCQHGQHPERASVEPRLGHDGDDHRRPESDRQWRRLQDAAHAAVERRRAAAGLCARARSTSAMSGPTAIG